jgi:hypothetical protein
MEDTAKYLVHADIVADGVVERSDVVGAIFGQTEGLLGEELDLRSLQRASKVGRINVEIDSENGQSFGQVSIATSLDRIETAILAAALETIDRVGPCRSNVAISRVEDVRAAKRRAVVERAKDLLGEFDESVLSTRELVEEVRESVRVEDITEHEGLPAGPRVGESDAVIVVEGRADVLTLLRYGVKNAIAVEGTNVPEVVADLTPERLTTAFLDGDRGGDLILKELGQVGQVDHVAIAPPGRSVEDLTRREALAALRGKIPYAEVADAGGPREALAATDGSSWPAPDAETEAGTEDGTDTSESDRSERNELGGEEAGTDGTIDPGDVAPPAEIDGVDAGAGSVSTDAATGTGTGATTEAASTIRSEAVGPASTANADEAATVIEEPTSETGRPADLNARDVTEATAAVGSASAVDADEPVGSGGETASPASDAPPAADETTETTEATETPAGTGGAEAPETAGSAETPEATAAEQGTGPTDPAEPGESEDADRPETLHGHVRAVLDSNTVRTLDESLGVLAEAPAEEAFDAIAGTEADPTTVVLDGELTQRVLDIVAQRGVEQVIAREEGAFVKQPTSVRVRAASEFRSG